jgi:hypothetical protein
MRENILSFMLMFSFISFPLESEVKKRENYYGDQASFCPFFVFVDMPVNTEYIIKQNSFISEEACILS